MPSNSCHSPCDIVLWPNLLTCLVLYDIYRWFIKHTPASASKAVLPFRWLVACFWACHLQESSLHAPQPALSNFAAVVSSLFGAGWYSWCNSLQTVPSVCAAEESQGRWWKPGFWFRFLPSLTYAKCQVPLWWGSSCAKTWEIMYPVSPSNLKSKSQCFW